MEYHDHRGFLQTKTDPPTSPHHPGDDPRRHFLLLPEVRHLPQYRQYLRGTTAAHTAHRIYPDPRSRIDGHQGLDRNASAQRPGMVALPGIHRQYSSRAHPEKTV